MKELTQIFVMSQFALIISSLQYTSSGKTNGPKNMVSILF